MEKMDNKIKLYQTIVKWLIGKLNTVGAALRTLEWQTRTANRGRAYGRCNWLAFSNISWVEGPGAYPTSHPRAMTKVVFSSKLNKYLVNL